MSKQIIRFLKNSEISMFQAGLGDESFSRRGIEEWIHLNH